MSESANVRLIDFSGQHRQWREENARQQAVGIQQYRQQMQAEFEREKAAIQQWRAETDRNAAQWQSYRQSEQATLVANEPDVQQARDALQAAAVVVNECNQDVQLAEVELAKHTRPADKSEIPTWAREHAELQAALDAYKGLLAEAESAYRSAQAKLERVQNTALERLRLAVVSERDKVLAAGREEVRALHQQLDDAVQKWDAALQPILSKMEVLGLPTSIPSDRPVYDERDPQLAPPWQRPQVAA